MTNLDRNYVIWNCYKALIRMKTEIFTYAHWLGLLEPKLIGTLTAHFAKGRKAFSFEYDSHWLQTESAFLLDPEIRFFSGPQFAKQENFGVFMDSMPDTWGKTLMKRKAAQEALEKGLNVPKLYDIDYLLGVYDETRMGALRFKTNQNGPFLDADNNRPTPPWSDIRKLQAAAKNIEDNAQEDVKEWLSILIAPGSSLGGARPKANITDENQNLWIAKFPSKNDIIDKGSWEFLAHQLAIRAGILMAPCRIQKISGNYHTFFTKRFDRLGKNRIHFSSAMTMTGFSEEKLRFETASYLDIAEFILIHGVDVDKNLEQLWRRIIFNILISNTDDHLRNHGFILSPKGWELSPAYDINPSVEKNHLALNINEDDSSLNIELAESVGEYFRLKSTRMRQIISDVKVAVATWHKLAQALEIPKSEQELMRAAFNY